MPPDPPATGLAAQAGAETAAYTEAMHELLLPLMRILVAKGIGYLQLDALVQRDYVEAAERWFAGDGERPTAGATPRRSSSRAARVANTRSRRWSRRSARTCGRARCSTSGCAAATR